MIKKIKELWNSVFKRKVVYNKLVLEIDPSINNLIAREIILDLNNRIIIDKMKMCSTVKNIDSFRYEYIVDTAAISFFEYRYWLIKLTRKLQDYHLEKHIRIPFDIKVFYDIDEADLDKPNMVFKIELDRVYGHHDWNVIKADFE